MHVAMSTLHLETVYFLGLARTVTGRQGWGGEGLGYTRDFFIQKLPLPVCVSSTVSDKCPPSGDDGAVSSDFVIFLFWKYFVSLHHELSEGCLSQVALLLQDWDRPKIPSAVLADTQAPPSWFVRNQNSVLLGLRPVFSIFPPRGGVGGGIWFSTLRTLLPSFLNWLF